jgi:hypothetical protein
MADLAEFWPGETLAGLLRRMVCQACGNGVMEARLLRERPLRPREPEIIAVRGRGIAVRGRGIALRGRGVPH